MDGLFVDVVHVSKCLMEVEEVVGEGRHPVPACRRALMTTAVTIVEIEATTLAIVPAVDVAGNN